MPPRAQFDQPQRSFLTLEFHKRRGTRDFLPGLLADFAAQFLGARVPSRQAISGDMHKKFVALRRAILDMRARAQKCINANGGHFEK